MYVLDKEKVKNFNTYNVKFDEFTINRSLLRNSDHELYNLNLVKDLSQSTHNYAANHINKE
jgi:hypothetical protein